VSPVPRADLARGGLDKTPTLLALQSMGCPPLPVRPRRPIFGVLRAGGTDNLNLKMRTLEADHAEDKDRCSDRLDDRFVLGYGRRSEGRV